MSLRKLWNSLRGNSSEPESAVKVSDVTPAPAAVAPFAAVAAPAPSLASAPAARPTASPHAERAITPTPTPAVRAKVTAPTPVAEVAAPRRSILSLLSRGEHDALLKLIDQRRPTSILEIGIGNGSRMPAILAAVAQSGVEPGAFKAIVVDEFEMAGGEVTMRDYHRQLAGLTIRPVIFPESVARGLVNIAHRFGAVDMILIDTSVEETHAEGLAKYLGKVSHCTTAVLSNASGKWTIRQGSDNLVRRAA